MMPTPRKGGGGGRGRADKKGETGGKVQALILVEGTLIASNTVYGGIGQPCIRGVAKLLRLSC